MTTIPQLNFGKGPGISREEFEKLGQKGGKGFQPGQYTVTIKDPKFHENKQTGSIFCKNDPSWFNVSMTLVSGEREKKMFLQVPTESPAYKTKKGLTDFTFRKLAEFMAGIGVYMDFNNYPQVVTELLSTPEALLKLEGKEMDIEVGYDKPYVDYIAKDQYQIITDIVKMTPYMENDEVVIFSSADEAVAFGLTTLNKNLQQFPEILNVLPRKAEVKSKAGGWD